MIGSQEHLSQFSGASNIKSHPIRIVGKVVGSEVSVPKFNNQNSGFRHEMAERQTAIGVYDLVSTDRMP